MHAKCPTLVGLQDTKSEIVFHYKSAGYFTAQIRTKYSAFSLEYNKYNLWQERFPL